MPIHTFELAGRWQGGLYGVGEISSGALQSEVSVPRAMGGPGTGTNPEELVLGAASTCYLITLASALQRGQLPVESIELATRIEVVLEKTLRLTHIVHRPRIRLAAGATAAQLDAARASAHSAEQSCMITNAIRGNVEIVVEPTVVAG
jgi:peroxiredoxin-like protein